MASYWTVLGLPSPPTDMKTVKKAYARKLKITRPDDDPEGFMALREAYEVAKAQIQHAQEYADHQDLGGSETLQVNPDEYSEDVQTEPSRSHFAEDEGEPAALQHDPQPEQEYPFFYHEIQEVLHTANKSNNKNAWRELIARARESSIDEYIDFDAALRGALLKEFGYYDEDLKKHDRDNKPPFITSFTATAIFKEMDWHSANEREFYIQQELDWLRLNMDVMNINRTPRGGSYKTESINGSDETGPNAWMIIFAIVAGIQILRLLLNTFGEGGY